MVDGRRKPVTQGIELNNGVSMLIPRKRLVPLDPDDFEQAAATGNYTCPHLHCPYSNYCLGFSTRVQRNHHMLHCLFRPNNNNNGGSGIIISQPQAETDRFQVSPPQLVVEALANEAAGITNSVSSLLLETGRIAASQSGAAVNSYSVPLLITPPASSMIMEAIPEYSWSNITPPMKYKVPDQHYYPAENNNGVFGNTTYGDLSGVINNNNLQQEVVVTTDQQQGFYLSAENGGFDLDNISELQIDELLKDVYHLIN